MEWERKVKGILLSGAIAAIFAFFGTPALIKILANTQSSASNTSEFNRPLTGR
jgi:hypothetical protein